LLRYLNYPRYPETFEFDKLSIYWHWLLVYFYSDINFLSKLPLNSKDVKKILTFRKFINFNFFSLINFNKVSFVKNNFILSSYNENKDFYRLFFILTQKSNLLNFFMGLDNFFLKFLLINNYIFKKYYYLHIYSFFYKPYANYLSSYKMSNLIFLKQIVRADFLMFVFSSLLKSHRKFYLIENYFFLNKFIFAKLINGVKKPLHQCKNYFFKESLEWLKYFNMQKKYFNIKLNGVYYKVWFTFISNLDGKKTYLISFKNFLKNNPVSYNNKFVEFFKYYWPAKLQNDTFTKFIEVGVNKNNVVFFLRKNKIFNKGRYSRNRQIYRTGVYMCLWINIIFVYFYIFSFYRFAFNFGYMWVGIGLFIISMVLGRGAKYRLYNFKNFLNEGCEFFNWCGFLGPSLFYSIISHLKKFLFNF